MMKILSWLLLLLCAPMALANSEYQQWLAEQQKDFRQYLTKQDAELRDQLAKDWQDFQTRFQRDEWTAPKPVDQPSLPIAETPEVKQPSVRLPTPAVESLPKLILPEGRAKTLTVEFGGLKPEFTYPDGLNRPAGPLPDNKQVADWWQAMALTDVDDLIVELGIFRQHYHLNDWDTIQLLLSLSGQLHIRQSDRILLTWFLLKRSDLDVRLAYAGAQWYLMFRSQQDLVATPYLQLGAQRYYLYWPLSETRSMPISLITYGGPSLQQGRSLNLLPHRELNLGGSWDYRSLSFSYQQKRYEIRFPYSETRIAHLKNYPRYSLDSYLSVKVPQTLVSAMQKNLVPLLEGKDQMERWNFLLAMVQQGFDYQTDEQQFGAERYLLAEESLFYRYNDCEDRTYFLSGLLAELTGEQRVALKFPNHLALGAALELSNFEGYQVEVSQVPYALLDPTYLYAPPGQLMPQLVGNQPDILVIN